MNTRNSSPIISNTPLISPQRPAHQQPSLRIHSARGLCPHCGSVFALKVDGNLRSHRNSSGICKGAGQAPSQVCQSDSPAAKPEPADSNPVQGQSHNQNTGPAIESAHQSHPVLSRIRFDDDEREELLSSPIGTACVLDYANRCGKAIRSAVAAAATDSNFDPILALKIVLAAAPPHRRGEMRKRRLDAFFGNDSRSLMEELRKQKSFAHTTRGMSKRKLNAQGADAAAMTALTAGMPGRALKRLTQNGTLPPSEKTFKDLQALHPSEPLPSPCSNPRPPPPISSHQVAMALKAMRQSAAGPSGLRADHLLLAFKGGVSQNLLAVLNEICKGTAPCWLADAKLFALPKTSGGVRPIAVGETLRRLAATVLIRSALPSLPAIVRQFVLRRDGCITMATLVKSALELRNSECVLTIDLKNAFNTVRREAVLKAVSGTPVSQYSQWAYGSYTQLRFGNFSLISSSGVQQGDPAGPLLFAMTLGAALSTARQEFSNGVADLWYADDGYLVGPEEHICTALNTLEPHLAFIGLSINQKKCSLWRQQPGPEQCSAGVRAINIQDSEQPLTVLGFPVAGSRLALTEFGKSASLRATEAIEPLSNLHHAQGEAVILRACGPTARLRHLLRFPIGDEVYGELLAADLSTLKNVERIIARPLPIESADIVAQPIANGGLGFRRIIDIDRNNELKSANLSIERTTRDVIDTDALNGLSADTLEKALGVALSRPLPMPHSANAAPTPPIDSLTRMVSESACSPHASDFLLARPGPATTMNDDEFRDAVWLRLGLSAPSGHSACSPSPQLDWRGVHRLGCRNSAGLRTCRHDDITSVVAEAAANADPRSFRVAREERLIDAENSSSRPGDVGLDLGSGRCLVDITVASPFSGAGQVSSRLAGSPAAAAENAYDRKMAKWHALLEGNLLDPQDLGTTFQPLAVSALGVWDERSLRWLRRFSDVCAASTGSDKGTAFSDLMTRLSVALWRGNSRLSRDLLREASGADDVIP